MNYGIDAVEVVIYKEKANYPFIVELHNSINWQTKTSYVSLDAAKAEARVLRRKHPRLPVRVVHYTGGFMPSGSLPVYRAPIQVGEPPYDQALWTGAEPPPAFGSVVTVQIDGSDVSGVVAAYGVQDGYLGVIVKLDKYPVSTPISATHLVLGSELK